MSVWRTVWVVGSIDPFDLRVLQGWGAPSISGRTDWLSREIDMRGIFRGELDDLVGAMTWVAATAPNSRVTIHVSPTYEERTVEQTIIVAMGTITTGSATTKSFRPETEPEAVDRAMSDWETGAMRWQP